ncbi:MAG: hypothetical protein FJX18_01420 [Alphaproteobacteria bacterium]|nr:hypothetical protein [Alphaproteobacteria bacterium]
MFKKWKSFEKYYSQKIGMRFLFPFLGAVSSMVLIGLFDPIGPNEIRRFMGVGIGIGIGSELINFPGEKNPAKWRIRCNSRFGFAVFLGIFSMLGYLGGWIIQSTDIITDLGKTSNKPRTVITPITPEMTAGMSIRNNIEAMGTKPYVKPMVGPKTSIIPNV